jgi:hypothetical protein
MQSSTAGGNRPRSRLREGRSAGSLAGMPGGLADTRAVVARDISGPRYSRKAPHIAGFSFGPSSRFRGETRGTRRPQASLRHERFRSRFQVLGELQASPGRARGGATKPAANAEVLMAALDHRAISRGSVLGSICGPGRRRNRLSRRTPLLSGPGVLWAAPGSARGDHGVGRLRLPAVGPPAGADREHVDHAVGMGLAPAKDSKR